ncbi:MAG: hypothetical protein KGJ78_03420 [Alphaproteobacteria bacterium]|nr:hypothetical protein [Alphaproteobacteria bacterium]
MTAMSERPLKHRFAQVLCEAFCANGLEKNFALEDAYALTDARYPDGSAVIPEDAAIAVLRWWDTEEQEEPAHPPHIRFGSKTIDGHAGRTPQEKARCLVPAFDGEDQA